MYTYKPENKTSFKIMSTKLTQIKNLQYLYIKTENLYGISKGKTEVYQLNWPESNSLSTNKPNLQACKYLGKLISDRNQKVRLEVCKFLVCFVSF